MSVLIAVLSERTQLRKYAHPSTLEIARKKASSSGEVMAGSGSQSRGRERGNEGGTSKDTTQLLNAQTQKPKNGITLERRK